MDPALEGGEEPFEGAGGLLTVDLRVLGAAEGGGWGRRRWNVEGSFRVEKHGGFGLEHTFCNDDTAGRNYHVLMQIAYALWQVFDTGVLSRLSEGCRKPTQEMWAKILFLALLVLGFASVPKIAPGAFRMRRYHLVAPPRALRSLREILPLHGGCDNRVPRQIWNLLFSMFSLASGGAICYICTRPLLYRGLKIKERVKDGNEETPVGFVALPRTITSMP